MKAISEAIFLGVAHCMKRGDKAAASIRENLNPLGQMSYTIQNPDPKLLCTIFTGGKAANSAVKFTKFYLIIDGSVNADLNLQQTFKGFVNALKSKFTVGKGGESAFKLL